MFLCVGESVGVMRRDIPVGVKESGTEVRQKGRKRVGAAVEKEICRLYDEGYTNSAIAERFGINPRTVTTVARRNGCKMRGKWSNTKNGGLAAGIKRRAKYLERFDSLPDGFTCLDKSDYKAVIVRCDRCGSEFPWSRDTWRTLEPCPTCRAEQAVQKHAEYEQKLDEKRQQREAAREWRESVPQVCKECGEPFYSDRDGFYCCDACRKRAANRRKPRTRRRGKGFNAHKRRMRIKVTPATFDRTVTLGAVYKKYHGRCCNCGCETVRSKKYRPDRATLDHVIALNNNGTHTWDNVQLLCTACNSEKRDLGQMRLAIAV